MSAPHRRGLVLVLAATLIACGGEDAARDPAPGATADSVPSPLPGHLVVDEVVPPPPLLARACIAGSPDEGLPWIIDSAGGPPLHLERIDSITPRDSAELAVRLTRMVDVIPTDTAIADFRGLPVTVRSAARATLADGDTIFIAIVDRRLPMESSPLEERFTVIAAPGHRSGIRGALVEGWFAREAGTEDALVARELGGVFASDSVLTVAFIEETPTRVGAALIERRAGRWIPSWSGLLPSCAAR